MLYPFLSLCAVFSCVQKWYINTAASVSGLFTCVQMLMHAIAHGGGGGGGAVWTPYVTESAQEVDSGRKMLCRTGDSKPVSVLRLAFQSDALATELSQLLNRCYRGYVTFHLHNLRMLRRRRRRRRRRTRTRTQRKNGRKRRRRNRRALVFKIQSTAIVIPSCEEEESLCNNNNKTHQNGNIEKLKQQSLCTK